MAPVASLLNVCAVTTGVDGYLLLTGGDLDRDLLKTQHELQNIQIQINQLSYPM